MGKTFGFKVLWRSTLGFFPEVNKVVCSWSKAKSTQGLVIFKGECNFFLLSAIKSIILNFPVNYYSVRNVLDMPQGHHTQTVVVIVCGCGTSTNITGYSVLPLIKIAHTSKGHPKAAWRLYIPKQWSSTGVPADFLKTFSTWLFSQGRWPLFP